MLQTIAITTGCMMTQRLDLKYIDIIYTAGVLEQDAEQQQL